MEKEKIDHQFTDRVVCPHCGHKHTDCTDWHGYGVASCEACEKQFRYESEYSVSYITSKLEPEIVRKEPDLDC